MEYISNGKNLNSTEYIYNDNAHLNKVFHNIVGQSPSKLFEDIHKIKKINVYQLEMPGANSE